MKARTPEETYESALKQAQATFAELDPTHAAARAAVAYSAGDGGQGTFQVPFFGATYQVHWPGALVARAGDQGEPDVATRLVLLHYLATADGAPMAGKWIAFRNLPGGMGYDAAFQRRANQPLAATFGADRPAFEVAARMLWGERLHFGDAAFCFRLLPRIWMAVIVYLADEEFPASVNVLFDACAEHYLPTEDLAVLGGILAGRLIKAARGR